MTVYKAALVDPHSLASVTKSMMEHHINEGQAFTCDHGSASLATAATVIILFKTPADTHCHVSVLAAAGGVATLQIREDPTYDDNTGATLPVFNRDRNSGNTTGVIDIFPNPDEVGAATSDPTSVAAGTVIYTRQLALGARTGGVRESKDFILLPEMVYAFIITAITNNIPVQLAVNWYEHVHV